MSYYSFIYSIPRTVLFNNITLLLHHPEKTRSQARYHCKRHCCCLVTTKAAFKKVKRLYPLQKYNFTFSSVVSFLFLSYFSLMRPFCLIYCLTFVLRYCSFSSSFHLLPSAALCSLFGYWCFGQNSKKALTTSPSSLVRLAVCTGAAEQFTYDMTKKKLCCYHPALSTSHLPTHRPEGCHDARCYVYHLRTLHVGVPPT